MIANLLIIILSCVVNGDVTIREDKRLRIDPSNQNGFETLTERENDSVAPLIVGGNDAPKGVFEDIVCNLVGSGGFGHYCGCTIIAPDVALTAAHCYYEEFTEGDFVEIGKYYIDKNNKKNKKVFKFRITKVYQHKNKKVKKKIKKLQAPRWNQGLF